MEPTWQRLIQESLSVPARWLKILDAVTMTVCAGMDSLAMAVTAIKGLPPQQQLVLVAAVRLLGEGPMATQPAIGSPRSQTGTPSAHRPLAQLPTVATPSTSARKPPMVRCGITSILIACT